MAKGLVGIKQNEVDKEELATMVEVVVKFPMLGGTRNVLALLAKKTGLTMQEYLHGLCASILSDAAHNAPVSIKQVAFGITSPTATATVSAPKTKTVNMDAFNAMVLELQGIGVNTEVTPVETETAETAEK